MIKWLYRRGQLPTTFLKDADRRTFEKGPDFLGWWVPVGIMVRTMADLFASFSSAVDTVSAPRPASTPSFFGGSPQPVTVKEASGTGFWGAVLGIFDSEKRVSGKPTGRNQVTLTVDDYTGASANDAIRGHVPQQRVKATQVGSQIITEATSNAGDSAYNQVLGVTESKGSPWY